MNSCNKFPLLPKLFSLNRPSPLPGGCNNFTNTSGLPPSPFMAVSACAHPHDATTTSVTCFHGTLEFNLQKKEVVLIAIFVFLCIEGSEKMDTHKI